MKGIKAIYGLRLSIQKGAKSGQDFLSEFVAYPTQFVSNLSPGKMIHVIANNFLEHKSACVE